MYPDGCALEGAKPGDFGFLSLTRPAAIVVPRAGCPMKGAVTMPDGPPTKQGVNGQRSGQGGSVPRSHRDPPDERPVRAVERGIAEDLMAGRRHVLEAELKECRRTPRQPGHESRPPTTGD
jgi:hypothetical protein